MAQACKFRHVFGQAAKGDKQFSELPSPLTSGEGPYVKASHKYMAFSSTLVRRLYVRKLDSPGRFSSNECHIGPESLKGKIWDFDFHPFNDKLLAMGDDNGKVSIVTLPDSIDESGNLTTNISESTIDFGSLHSKKCILLSFHPCANNILATGSFDRTVKICDINNSKECISTIDGFGDTIYSMEWNRNGNLMGISSKDKTIRVVDPRTIGNNQSNNNNNNKDNITINKAFDGVKSSKVFWLSNMNCIGATGFSKTARRKLKLWDLRMISQDNTPLINHTIDQASSILMPHYDEDNNLLFMAGKGDGTVTYGEFRNDYKLYHLLGTYRSPEPQRGGGWVPKRGLNVWKCEIERFLKLTRKSIIPVSFIVPRKAGNDIFQEDIYPAAYSGVPSMTAKEWINGDNKGAILMSLDPNKQDQLIESTTNEKVFSNVNIKETDDKIVEKQKAEAKEEVRTTKELIEQAPPSQAELQETETKSNEKEENNENINNKIEKNEKNEKNVKNDENTKTEEKSDLNVNNNNNNKSKNGQMFDELPALNETDGDSNTLTLGKQQKSTDSLSDEKYLDDGNTSVRSRASESVMIRPFSPTTSEENTEALERENMTLKKENDKLNETINDLNNENDTLKDENQQLKDKIKELEAALQNEKSKGKHEEEEEEDLLDDIIPKQDNNNNNNSKQDDATGDKSIWEDSD